MYPKTAVMTAWPTFGAAMVARTLFAGDVVAKEVTVAYQVSAKGLGLRQPAGAKEFYGRLKKAAWIVCTHGSRVDLQALCGPGRLL